MRRFVTHAEAAAQIRGKTVIVVGSAPSVLDNDPGFVDSHDVVVRVNNYKLGPAQGTRVDVHYAFYGFTVMNGAEQLRRDGVRLCWCKCPNAKPVECAWHERHGAQRGIDFRNIYRERAGWWFCDTYIPSVEEFMQSFELLGRHIPTTGFAAILAMIACGPARLSLTGFDFFTSRIHNVDEPWKPGPAADPIGHRPDLEAAWLRRYAHENPDLQLDVKLTELLRD